ncbi:YutD family protein [Lactobacillus sp. PV034]|uniref:YutD family protein n=1 Tax=Lactobacillus sp. PV034 TaxID=2594495 RepID=UPI0022409767|nr:YutD family protein [Lactobacillus sp. PV034]QNQ81483.1 DUF1027 domain-containing protein [Lactobacillus sp. PV034]
MKNKAKFNDKKDNNFKKKEREQPTEPVKKFHPDAHIVMGEGELLIEGRKYEILTNEKNALDVSLLKEKYDPFLNQYDYLVGDIASEHLRLKGFYDSKDHVAIDKKALTIVDYLDEYSNPGSPYFILHLIGENQVKRVVLGRKNKHKKRNLHSYSGKRHNFKERKVRKTTLNSHHGKVVKKSKNRGFIIKKRGDK